jgi:hypothetical protein
MLRVIGLSFVLLGAVRGQQLEIQDPEISTLIADKSGNASINVTLKNTGGAKIPVDLTADFKHKLPDGSEYPLNTTLTVTGATSEDVTKLKQELAGGATVRVKLTVSQIGEAGESIARLFNAGSSVTANGKLVKLHAVRLPATYNVQFETQNPEVFFAPDSRPVVHLVNNDAMTYQFDWEVVPQRGHPAPGKCPVTLPANGTVDLDLSSAAFERSLLRAGTLKDDVQDATLVLKPHFDTTTAIPLQPAKRLPMKMRLRFWGRSWQEVWAFLWTLVFLGVGAWLSLVFRIYIPNAAGAFKLKRQLCEMKEKINGTGEDLPSQWRVLLHWRFEKCRTDIDAYLWWTPGFTTILAATQTRVEMYAEWVEIAYAVSVVLGEANRDAQTGIPPTLFGFIQEKCNAALAPIATGYTTLEDLQSMKAALKTAEDYSRSIRTDAVIPSLETAIAEREKALKKTLANEKVRTDLLKCFPQFEYAFDQSKDNKDNKDEPEPLTPRVYFDRDASSLKADLLREFRELELRRCCENKPASAAAPPDGKTVEGAAAADATRQSTAETANGLKQPESSTSGTAGQPAAQSGVATAASQRAGSGAARPRHAKTACDRLNDKRDDFMKFIIPDAYSSVRIAQLIMAEMRQDFYPEPALREAIEKKAPRSIGVHVHPQSEAAAAQEASVGKTAINPADAGASKAPPPPNVMRINRDAVQFALRFQREQLNGVAAVQEWTCEWNFGDGTEHEYGWAVYHRYSEEGEYNITVKVVDLDGKQVGDDIDSTVSVKDNWTSAKRTGWRSHWPPRWLKPPSAEAKVEAMRILFVLGIALVGVLVTARGKAEALDVFQGAGALIALGFGVDTLKTLLTQKSAEK